MIKMVLKRRDIMNYEDIIKITNGYEEIALGLYEFYLAYVEAREIERKLPYDFKHSVSFRLYHKDLNSFHYEIYKDFIRIENKHAHIITKQEREFEKKVLKLNGIKNNNIYYEKNEVLGNKLFYRRNLNVFFNMKKDFSAFLLHMVYIENKDLYSDTYSAYKVYRGDELKEIVIANANDCQKIQREFKVYLQKITLKQNEILLRFFKDAIVEVKNYNKYVLALLEARKIKEVCMKNVFADIQKLNTQKEKTFM